MFLLLLLSLLLLLTLELGIHFFRIGSYKAIWGFPKIRGTILGVPLIRTMVFCGLCWGPPILGNYHIELTKTAIKGLGIGAKG